MKEEGARRINFQGKTVAEVISEGVLVAVLGK